jgi:hypothetical protein
MKPSKNDIAQYLALQSKAGSGYKSAIERKAPKQEKKEGKTNGRRA